MSVRHLPWLKGAAAALTAGVVAVSIAGCASTTPSGASTDGASREITIGWSAAAPFVLPALLAADNSVEPFTERGLKFKGSLVSAPDALPLLSTGKLDVFMGPVSAGVFNAVGHGTDLAIVAPGGTSTTASNWFISTAALKGQPYTGPEQWKGQTVYTSTGAGSYVMISLAHILEGSDVKLTDLKLTTISPSDVAPAIKNGSIFAGIPASVKDQQSLLQAGEAINGPSAVWPEGISPGFIFFGSSLLHDDPALAQKILDAFVDLYKNDLQGDYQTGPLQAEIAKVLDYEPDQVPTLVTQTYPADMSFPEGWTKNAEDVWRSLPDVLSYQDSVADKVVDTELIDKALKDVG